MRRYATLEEIDAAVISAWDTVLRCQLADQARPASLALAYIDRLLDQRLERTLQEERS